LQNAERYTILRTAPEYLILSLNRFEYDRHTNIFRKLFTKLNYPKVLNVHVHPKEHSTPHARLAKYCLVSIIVHTGYTLHGGHYYVYAREIKPSTSIKTSDEVDDYFADDEWILLNDDTVTLSSYEALIENCAQYTSATPYVLFYKRVDEQRMELLKQTRAIRMHDSLLSRIDEDNKIYRCEQDECAS
jgi:ubiquitin carboxyl-terminal hydrolase 35/38